MLALSKPGWRFTLRSIYEHSLPFVTPFSSTLSMWPLPTDIHCRCLVAIGSPDGTGVRNFIHVWISQKVTAAPSTAFYTKNRSSFPQPRYCSRTVCSGRCERDVNRQQSILYLHDQKSETGPCCYQRRQSQPGSSRFGCSTYRSVEDHCRDGWACHQVKSNGYL